MLRTVIDRLPIGWAGRLALQRLLSQWRSLLTVIAGTLLGAAVGALVPLYTAAVAQVSMVEKLNQLPPNEVNAVAEISLIPSKTPNLSEVIHGYDTQFRQIIDDQIGQPFPGWLNRTIGYAETTPLDVDPPAEVSDPGSAPIIPNPTTRVFVAYYEDWPNSVVLVGGRLPKDSPADPTKQDIEIVVPLAAQNALGIKAGDVLLLDQGGPRGGWPSSKNVRALVTGIVSLPEQLKPLQRAYFMEPSPLRFSKGNGYIAEYPVLTTRNALDRVASAFIPDTPTRYGWRLLLDPTRLPFSRSPDARQALFALNGGLDKAFGSKDQNLQFTYATKLIDWKQQNGQNVDNGILLAYERSVKTLDTPFGLLLLQVGALVIFFLIVTAALVRRGERREIAMLQSRGAQDRSIILIRGIEAFLICALAAVLAPPLAQQLLILITPFFARYENLPLLLTSTVFAYSTIAAAVAFLALMFTLRPVLKLPLISGGGSTLRSDRQPWWQRYYVDLLLAILGIAALWRLVGRDTPLFTTTAGGRTTDPFLLLAPALLFLGLGSLLLRLFPLLATAFAKALEAGRGLTGPLATWQLSREPIHYGRITFLLALAIGIGWFATSFRATLNRSQVDQAQYRVGGDIRLTEQDMRLNVPRARSETAYTQIPGVAQASVVWHQPALNIQSEATKSTILSEIIAVNADTLPPAVYWRSDLGPLRTPREAGQSPNLPDRGEALPFSPQKLGLWADFTLPGPFNSWVPDLDRLRNRTRFYARLLDSSGAWLIVPFQVTEVEYASTGPQVPGLAGGGSFNTTGWAYLEADVKALSYKPVGTVRLVSLYWSHRGRQTQGETNLRLQLGALSATNDTGEKAALNFLDSGSWDFAFDSGAFSTGKIGHESYGGKHGSGLTIQWDQRAAFATLGALLNYPDAGDVPMIASEGLLAQLGIQRGQTLKVSNIENTTVSFVVRDSQRYYPTLYDALSVDKKWISDSQNHAFIVADLTTLLYVLNRRPSATVYAQEAWLKVAPGANTDDIVKAARPSDQSGTLLQADTLSGALANLQTDPLSLGLLGLMFLAFVIAITLSIVGMLTYAALTAAARRSEFGVLRALGLSSLRLILQLALEQGFVIVLATVLGAILGVVLSTQVVPRLAIDTSSKIITPPFIVQVEAAALLQYGLVILGVLIIVLLFSLLVVRRLSLSRSLRLGEE